MKITTQIRDRFKGFFEYEVPSLVTAEKDI